jgi:hypothetical protein
MFSNDSHFELGTPSRPGASPAGLDALDLETHALGTFDDFAAKSEDERGVTIESLDVGTVLTVGTKHSCYRFVILDPATKLARVTGGSLFPEPTDVRIDGATIGGSMIKAGWVGVGLRMEFTIGRRRITTSRVKFLSVDDGSLTASVA